ncbi:MAG TPA: FKBP-type peptidyl-prolyl cis-trans isomerase N-terminal domain-containing protein [Geothermobacteraceae bacterium]|nr:FKBP-type peptidyl-prolyl cis-trans isomerase N-terminal domain-containing protein [Geothermobacteraceae bacterium]
MKQGLKSSSLIPLLGLLLVAAPALGAPLELKDETAKISYSLGYQIGGDFKQQQVGIDAAAVVQGIQDALADSKPLLTQQQMNELLVSLKQQVVATQRQELFQNSNEFLAANRKKEGVTELPSGVQYRIIEAGEGVSPTLEDTVALRFHATRTDGTPVVSTGKDESRNYQVKSAIPPLRQVLLMMKPGAHWEVVIPPSNRIKLTERNGALIYDLELVSVQAAATGQGS